MANMFALILVIATLVTGLLWCLDKFIFAPKRRERQSITGEQLDAKTMKKVSPKPGWLETGASVFPVLAVISWSSNTLKIRVWITSSVPSACQAIK